ncbi:MAG: DUF4097 family beta strand repeat-containing protein [Bryobacteraceae bacterium]|jgi:hypothetical protein
MKETAEGTFETILSVTGPATLDVAVDSGLVRVYAGDAGSVRIRGILRARRSLFGWGSVEDRIRQLEAKPPVEQNGNTVRVGDVADRWLLRGVALFLEIAVPGDTRIRALADSGDIRVQGVSGPVDCETDSGDVEVSAISADVHASSDSGSIRIRQVKGRVYASADAGDAEALDIAGDIEVSTDSGEIRISQTVAAPVRAEADSGGISVKLAPGAGYNVSLRTDHGRITVIEAEGQEIVWRTRSEREVDGRICGGGPTVDLETDSGDIDIV